MGHEILVPIYCRSDERGTFQEIIGDYQWASVISGTMHSGSKLGNHYHKKTLIFIFLLQGFAQLKTYDVRTCEKDSFSLATGQGVLLFPFQTHEIHFKKVTSFLMLKSIKYDPEDPDTYTYPVPDD